MRSEREIRQMIHLAWERSEENEADGENYRRIADLAWVAALKWVVE